MADEDEAAEPTVEELKEAVKTAEKSRDLHLAEAKKSETNLQAAKDGHTAEKAELQAKIDELKKGQETRIKKAVTAAKKDWTADIATRVGKLPSSWSPAFVAEKIVKKEYQHPQGIADFVPKLDDNGNVIRYDGELVPDPAHA